MAKSEEKTSNYEKLLKDLKEQKFRVEHLLAMTSLMTRMAATWNIVKKVVHKEPVGEALHPAWGYVEFNEAEWAMLVGATTSDVMLAFNVMARLNIIYPDGTCPKKVRGYLLAQANALLPSGQQEEG